MNKLKTSEMTGAALDWAVAKCEGIEWWAAEEPKDGLFIDYERTRLYSPSSDWSQGGPIIEREHIGLLPSGNAYYEIDGGTYYSYGPTPLIAAMRCYVASRLGDEVDVPEELL